MSMTLTPDSIKSAAESTVHTLSDLVEGVRDRIDDLPVGRSRRRHGRQKWVAMVAIAIVAMAALVVRRRRHVDHSQAEPETMPPRERRFAAAAS
jgi:hypothetical protein